MTHPIAETPATKTSAPARGHRLAVPALLLLNLLVFGQLCLAEFVEWDDTMTIARNPTFFAPLSEQLRVAWTTFDKGLYVPITTSIWAILGSLSKTNYPDRIGSFFNPWLFHSANVACHLVATWLVYRILRRLAVTTSAAWIGAAFFALHPLQVESVAWASGFKDILAWCLALAATSLYVATVQSDETRARVKSIWSNHPGAMAGVALLLVGAILSKPSAFVLPAALFVIDAVLLRPVAWRRVAIDLAPLFVIAAAGMVVARLAQYVHHVPSAPLWARPFISGDSVVHYLTKLVWPVSMGIDYGRTPAYVMSQPSTYAKWLVPAAIAVAILFLRRRSPRLFAGAILALIGVGPMLGLATFQMQYYSTVTDHYAYFAMLGIAIALTAGVDRAIESQPAITKAVAGLMLTALALRSAHQASLWKDSETLLKHCLEINPRSMAMPSNLASYYLTLEPARPDLAEPYIEVAYAHGPNDVPPLTNFVILRVRQGRDDPSTNAAIERLWAMLNDPKWHPSERIERLCEVINPLVSAGRLDIARVWAERAIETDPKSYRAQQAIAAVERAERARAATRPTTQSR